MTFEIVLTSKAKKQFSRLDKIIQKQIHEKLETVKDDPLSHEKSEFDILKLKVGDHTILSSIMKNSIRFWCQRLVTRIDKNLAQTAHHKHYTAYSFE